VTHEVKARGPKDSTLHTWSHVTHIDESQLHTTSWVMWLTSGHMYMWFDSYICVTWLIYMCTYTHINIYRYDLKSHVTHQWIHNDVLCIHYEFSLSFFLSLASLSPSKPHNTLEELKSRVTPQWSPVDVTHLYVWHVSSICMTWLEVCGVLSFTPRVVGLWYSYTATHCNTLILKHCNALQHIDNQKWAPLRATCSALQCNALQHIDTETLQRTATHW